jgi:hypothetical protein
MGQAAPAAQRSEVGPPSKIDVDVSSIILGVFIVASAIVLFKVPLPGFRPSPPTVSGMPPLFLIFAAGAAAALLRTTRVVGRIAASTVFLLVGLRTLSVASSMGAWDHGPRFPPGLLEVAGRGAAFLIMGGWLGWRAFQVSSYDRRIRRRREAA